MTRSLVLCFVLAALALAAPSAHAQEGTLYTYCHFGFENTGRICGFDPRQPGEFTFVSEGFNVTWSTLAVSANGQKRAWYGSIPPDQVRGFHISNLDGSERVTRNMEASVDGMALSPDLTHIAYIGQGLHVLNMETGEEITVVADAGRWSSRSWPIWSPDGTRLLFQRSDGGSSVSIFVVDADGQSPPFRLTSPEATPNPRPPGSNVSDSYADWSFDGSSVVFMRNFSGNTNTVPRTLEIYTVAPVEGALPTRVYSEVLAAPPNTANYHGIQWRPDGEYLALLRSQAEGNYARWTVSTMPASGGTPSPIYSGKADLGQYFPQSLLQWALNDIIVMAPARDDLVTPDETYSVRFDARGAASVDLYYSVYDGGERVLIAEDVPGAAGVYAWAVPADLLSPATILYIVDANDASREAQSDRFRVRERWRLHRIVGTVAQPEYEKMTLQNNGWGFDQRDANLWPEGYWRREQNFYQNTQVGFDPFVEPVPEVRYDPRWFQTGRAARDHPAWSSVVRAFGVTGTYASYNPVTVGGLQIDQVNPAAVRFWDTTFREADTGFPSSYSGACYGLAMGMLAAVQDPDRFDATWLPGVSGSAHLSAVPLTDPVRDAAHALFVYQYGQQQRAATVADHGLVPGIPKTTPRDVLEGLRAMFERDDRDLDRFLLLVSDFTYSDGTVGRGAHAIVPLGMRRLGGGNYEVGVFDPSEGFGPLGAAAVYIDSTANAWTYLDPSWHGATGTGLSLSIPASFAFEPALSPWLHVFGLSGIAGAPGGNASVASRGVAPAVWQLALAGADVAVTSAAGTLRYSEGHATETLPGGFISFPFTGRPSSPDAFVVPANGAYQARVTPSAGGAARVRVEGGAATAAVVQAGATDPTPTVVDVRDDGLVLVSGGAGTFDLEVLTAPPDSTDIRSGRASGLTLADPAALALTADRATGSFRLVGGRAAATYTLELGSAASGATRAFRHAGIPLAAGAVHTVRPDWSTLGEGPVTVEVDADGDGTPDGVLVLGNTVASEGPPAGVPAAVSLTVRPNPTPGAATVTLTLDAAQSASVGVFDVLGREVARLHDGPLAAGPHGFSLDTSGLTTGVYLVRATTEAGQVTQRITVVR